MTTNPPPTPNAAVNLAVSGMHCGSCATHVTRALMGVPGVRDAVVDLASARAAVTTEAGGGAVEALLSAVREAGYEAELA